MSRSAGDAGRLARIEDSFDRIAAGYDAGISCAERAVLGTHRAWAAQHASGAVLELACGTGLNLPHYGPAVTSVLGIDISEGMLARARERAAGLRGGPVVELRRGDVQELDIADESVDTVVSTLTMCTIPNPAAALRQAFRVLRPGGRLVLVEHGPARGRVLRGLMRAVNPVSVRFASDHLMRDPVPYVRAAAFRVEQVERAGLGGVAFMVVARRP